MSLELRFHYASSNENPPRFEVEEAGSGALFPLFQIIVEASGEDLMVFQVAGLFPPFAQTLSAQMEEPFERYMRDKAIEDEAEAQYTLMDEIMNDPENVSAYIWQGDISPPFPASEAESWARSWLTILEDPVIDPLQPLLFDVIARLEGDGSIADEATVRGVADTMTVHLRSILRQAECAERHGANLILKAWWS